MSPALPFDEHVAAIGADAATLDWIGETATHLAVWHRLRPAEFGWIDQIDWDAIEDLDFSAPLDGLLGEIADGLAEAGYPNDERGIVLRDEIATLARRFAAIMCCEAIKIRLEVVETDACRKFHADTVTARLLTTLYGPGTQWITTAAPECINQLSAGDVAIFKGRLLAEQPAILHRSPPIDGTDDTRLLLVIDVFDPARETTHG